MALKFTNMFGSGSKPADVDLDMPTTQVKLTEKETPGYDPLSTVSVMDQLRTTKSDVGMPSKLPGLSNLPVTKQFQVLGVLLVVFLLLAVVMIFVDGRQAAQSATATATATEMQMLSQRLARGAALAAQGQASAFASVRDSRDRFKANLDALAKGGNVRGVELGATGDATALPILNAVKDKWSRMETASGQLLANEQSLTTLAKGLDDINAGNSTVLELAQQAA
ncbi:MAG: type IV pili methyl-accepting chemotaxis transducer N-terminal domain-containing protein, partial [Casimicrobiaceae bacterium]